MNRLEAIEYFVKKYNGYDTGLAFATLCWITKGLEYSNDKYEYGWGDEENINRLYSVEDMDAIIKEVEMT